MKKIRETGTRPKNEKRPKTMKSTLQERRGKIVQEMEETNDATKLIGKVKSQLGEIFTQRFDKANATNSYDEKIQLLSEGVSEAFAWIEGLEEEIVETLLVMKTKLDVVEELIKHSEELEAYSRVKKSEDLEDPPTGEE